MLRGERDQNQLRLMRDLPGRIPECSGGSEIKTQQNGVGVLTNRYQNAPGGARSKRALGCACLRGIDTRMLRGERDQNRIWSSMATLLRIPECSGGSEIKTDDGSRLDEEVGYQNAPGGARSKPVCWLRSESSSDTRMLRGERDQNALVHWRRWPQVIPECSGGSEIKTGLVMAHFQDTGYQNAPGGARSKLRSISGHLEQRDTRMLRGERDQNQIVPSPKSKVQIPECSGGSEIKTRTASKLRRSGGYQNAPGGARSKHTVVIGGCRGCRKFACLKSRDQA